jgi:hypothetical protein
MPRTRPNRSSRGSPAAHCVADPLASCERVTQASSAPKSGTGETEVVGIDGVTTIRLPRGMALIGAREGAPACAGLSGAALL